MFISIKLIQLDMGERKMAFETSHFAALQSECCRMIISPTSGQVVFQSY